MNMGIPLNKVQLWLGLSQPYPYFPTWDEVLEFDVDGVHVKAIAIHAWRGESVLIVEPFAVQGAQYNESVFPPLFALAFSMNARKAALERQGLTQRDDSLAMARRIYRKHCDALQAGQAGQN